MFSLLSRHHLVVTFSLPTNPAGAFYVSFYLNGVSYSSTASGTANAPSWFSDAFSAAYLAKASATTGAKGPSIALL